MPAEDIWSEFLKLVSANNPEIEYQISMQEVKLSKTGSLPEFQIGYASEIVPGEENLFSANWLMKVTVSSIPRTEELTHR